MPEWYNGFPRLIVSEKSSTLLKPEKLSGNWWPPGLVCGEKHTVHLSAGSYMSVRVDHTILRTEPEALHYCNTKASGGCNAP